jgi:hypothetical protein
VLYHLNHSSSSQISWFNSNLAFHLHFPSSVWLPGLSLGCPVLLEMPALLSYRDYLEIQVVLLPWTCLHS